MNENFSTPELDLLDAERIIYEAEPAMNALLREFRPMQYAVLNYAFREPGDELRMVSFGGENLRGQISSYFVKTNQELYFMEVVHSVDDILEPRIRQMAIEISVWDDKMKVFHMGEDKDTIRLGELLSKFDAAEIREGVHEAIRERKATSGRKIFRRWHR